MRMKPFPIIAKHSINAGSARIGSQDSTSSAGYLSSLATD